MPDALLVVSFGGPEGSEDVMPFLRNVARGRAISEQRLSAVAEHYHLFGGISPINQCNRQFVAALEQELAGRNAHIPVYWGNRNWHPLLADTLAQMTSDGITSAVALATSAFGSYSGCRQYTEDIAQAQNTVGATAPIIHKLPPFWNQVGFLEAVAHHLGAALRQEPNAAVVFTAHSIPETMAATAPYVSQLEQACTQVAAQVGISDWHLAYQSRSGPPQVPWLEPDICAELERLAKAGATSVIVVPIGFVADHMEVIYDLDTEAQQRATELGIGFWRVPTVGTHPSFVKMIVDMAVASKPSSCPASCCLEPLPPTRRPAS